MPLKDGSCPLVLSLVLSASWLLRGEQGPYIASCLAATMMVATLSQVMREGSQSII